MTPPGLKIAVSCHCGEERKNDYPQVGNRKTEDEAEMRYDELYSIVGPGVQHCEQLATTTVPSVGHFVLLR